MRAVAPQMHLVLVLGIPVGSALHTVPYELPIFIRLFITTYSTGSRVEKKCPCLEKKRDASLATTVVDNNSFATFMHGFFCVILSWLYYFYYRLTISVEIYRRALIICGNSILRSSREPLHPLKWMHLQEERIFLNYLLLIRKDVSPKGNGTNIHNSCDQKMRRQVLNLLYSEYFSSGSCQMRPSDSAFRAWLHAPNNATQRENFG